MRAGAVRDKLREMPFDQLPDVMRRGRNHIAHQAAAFVVDKKSPGRMSKVQMVKKNILRIRKKSLLSNRYRRQSDFEI